MDEVNKLSDEQIKDALDIIAEEIKDNVVSGLSYSQVKLLNMVDHTDNDIKDMLRKNGLAKLQIDGFFNLYEQNLSGVEYNIPQGHTTREYENREVPKVNWLVEDLIPAGLIIIGAPSKSKKSFMMLDLCMQVSSGMDWFGKTTQKGTCLYFDLEVSADSTQRRIERLCQGKKVQFDNLKYFNLEDDEENQIKRIGAGFEEQFEQILLNNPNTRLVVIDMYQCIRPIRSQAESYQQDYADLGKLKRLVRKYQNLSVILVHHTRKSKDEDDYLNNLNGSTGLAGAVDGIILIDKKKRSSDDAIIHFEGKDIIQQDIQAKFDTRLMKWVAEGTVEEVEWMEFRENPITQAIISLCESTGQWQGTSAEFIESAWDEHKISINLDENDKPANNARMVGRFLRDNIYQYRKLGYIISTKPASANKTKYIFSKL